MSERPRNSRNPRKIIVRVVVFLVLGAIVNVAVAWGLGSWTQFSIASSASTEQPFANEPVTTDPATGERWGSAGLAIMRFKQAGAERVTVQLTPKTIMDWSIIGESQPRPPVAALWPWWGPLGSRTPQEIYESNPRTPLGYAARGWPMLSMWCEFEHGTHGRPRGGIDLGLSHTPGTFINTERVLPLRPIWPGFAINTLFYAGILWLVFAAPFALRRRRRIKRGLCPACAYPMGSSPVCTECGEAIPSRAVSITPSPPRTFSTAQYL